MLAPMLVTSSRYCWARWNATEKPLIDNVEPVTLYVIAFHPCLVGFKWGLAENDLETSVILLKELITLSRTFCKLIKLTLAC